MGAVVLGYAALPWGVVLGDSVEARVPVDGGLQVQEYGTNGSYFLQYRHGQPVTVTVPVTNHGPVPVTVSDVALDLPAYPLLEPSSATGLPLRLAPFTSGSVDLTLTYGNCRYYHERAVQVVSSATVTGTALGRGFTRTVDVEAPLTVHGQVIVNCPDRTLVRGDDVRAPGRG